MTDMADSTVELYSCAEVISRFTKEVLEKYNKQDGNSLFSPTSINAFLTLLSRDPWFHTRHKFGFVLHHDVNLAFAQYKEIFAALHHINNYVDANVSFLKNQVEVKDAFKNELRNTFASEVKTLDFTDVVHTAETINDCVRLRTSQKFSPFNDLKNDTWFASLNTSNFKGNWVEPFEINDTVPAKFQINEQNAIDVQMMHKKGQFYYKNDEYHGYKILKLPFANSNLSLVVVLPHDNKIDKVITELYNLSSLTMDMEKQEVDVSLPKFKMQENLEMAQYLKETCLEELFSANLIGVIEGQELSLNEIQQKIFLEVNETGSETAAGTLSTLTEIHEEKVTPKNGIIIYEAKTTTEISNRFAKTKVVWRVKNGNKKAADADFKVILTETAFITEFVMEIEGKSYKSYIKEKEEAKNIYKEAVAQGQSAGLVEATTRDSREFTVSVNLEPDSVAVFTLTYEEMLQRVHDQYELVLNICPGQIVDDFNIEVHINESRPIKFVKTPPLRSGNDMSMTEFEKHLDPKSDIKIINPKTASVKLHLDSKRQKKMAHYLRKKTSDGLVGQFVVQYDVEREPQNGEVLLQDGYFVHFFAPNDLDPLPKHVVFVLDTSGSMMGRKLEQVKNAMMNILSDLGKDDMLSVIEFNSDVVVWDVGSKKSTTISEEKIKDFKEPFAYLKKQILADPQRVSDGIISKAKEVVKDLVANGCTFIIGGLETALYLVKMGQKQNEKKDEKLQPIMIFLTDGQPNVGVHGTDEIVELVTNLNIKDKTPIFSLSFGDSADKAFLRKLSLKNLGFSRHIYEAADASLQLQEFYKQISSPLLHDIKFKYDAKVEEVTRTWFPIYFGGSELVVAGRCGEQNLPTAIDCCGHRGPIIIRSATERPVTSLERLWAYLTVKQLLDERETSKNPKQLTKKAVNLALRYSFVTDVTSLVVVKPNEVAPTSDDRPVEASLLPAGDAKKVGRQAHKGHRIKWSATRTSGTCAPRAMMMRCKMAPAPMMNLQCDSISAASSTSRFRQRRVLRGGGGDPPISQDNMLEHGAMDTDEVDEQLQVNSDDDAKKNTEEFKADHPFLIMLQMEVNNANVILFVGRVLRPVY